MLKMFKKSGYQGSGNHDQGSTTQPSLGISAPKYGSGYLELVLLFMYDVILNQNMESLKMEDLF